MVILSVAYDVSMAGLASILNWLRAPLRVRWNWPRAPLGTRRGPSAEVRAVRFVDPYGRDLELRNSSDGIAVDLEIAIVPQASDDESSEVLAGIPVLGAGVRYIVTLSADIRDEVEERLLRIAWRNKNGSLGQSCWAISDGRQLTEVPCPSVADEPAVALPGGAS